jgi:hypothetical protein
MVNTFNTEPDPEPDLEPDIRGYSQSNNQVNRGITSTTQPEPLSFVSSEPVPLAPIATRDAAINEKDYATPGTAGTGHGTMETTLNPSPSGQDTTSIYSSHHPDDEDQEPAFPFISWKTSAIVSERLYQLLISANDRTRSKDAQLSVPPRYYCRSLGHSPILASPMWSSLSPVC